MMEKEQVVVLIHGTWATAPDDHGDAWWQRSSEFWGWLNRNLPDGVCLQLRGQLFKWDGKNSAFSRIRAALELLRLLWTFEDAQQPYHLIAHSHGGIVVWMALKLATMRSRHGHPVGLSYLRSWTTVGTPFLQELPRLRTRDQAVSLLLLLFGVLLWVMYPGYWVTWVFAIIYVPVGFLIFYAEQRRNDAWGDTRASVGALRSFGALWLGIWSRHDEVIAGLSGSFHLLGPMTPRLSSERELRRRAELVSDRTLWLLSLPVRLFYRPVHNHIIAPRVDRIVWNAVRRRIHGSDRLNREAVGVSPAPHPGMLPLPNLPDAIEDQLLERANRGLGSTLPVLRNLLAQIAVGTPIGIIGQEAAGSLTGEELVHTSYFQSDLVRSLILAHITWASCVGSRRAAPEGAAPEVGQALTWVTAFKSQIDDRIPTLRPDKPLGTPRTLDEITRPALRRSVKAVLGTILILLMLLSVAVLVAGVWILVQMIAQML